ncbi:MAG: methylenetetrahydrofolate reductase, partial [Pseudomonadota bacterium]
MTRIPVSIEVTAKHALETEGMASLFPSGTRVYLADLGTHSVDGLVDAAARLHGCGFRPVPHIAARRMTDTAEADMRIARFMAEAHVDEFLMVAGSPEAQVGNVASSLELLEAGVLQKNGVEKIVVAGHPEGSPDFPDSELLPALKAKQAFGKANGIDMKVATQFSFDVPGMIAWEKALAAEGIDMPIHIGVAGPAKITTLIRYATLCGVGQSLSFLKKRGGALATMVTGFSPDEVVDPLEAHIASGEAKLIDEIHVFPFGGLKRASEWLTERGSWFE